MPDPDLEMRRGGVGVGGGQSTKNFFRPFGPQFGLKIRGDRGEGESATVSKSFFETLEHSNM